MAPESIHAGLMTTDTWRAYLYASPFGLLPCPTLSAAREQDIKHIPLVRVIFKAREIVLSSTPRERPEPRGLLAATRGWGVLAFTSPGTR